MREQYETVALKRPAPDVLQVTLNRPAFANAMNTQMGLDLLDIFTELFAKPESYRAVVVTGAGERAFCAGGDLKERQGMSDDQWQSQHLIFERMIRAILECPMPVVAAVNGAAYAGGCEIALGCDFIYAARTARFALTEVTIGIMPGAGGTQTLPRAVGMRRAKEILLTGKPFTAEQGYEWGMVNRLCEPGSLVQDALKTATTIAGNAPISIRQAKRSMQYGINMSLADGMLFEIEAYNRMVPTEDRREGISSFNEKRKPAFKGR
jgi:enoyl-CoA hydratase/carnithine racemase